MKTKKTTRRPAKKQGKIEIGMGICPSCRERQEIGRAWLPLDKNTPKGAIIRTGRALLLTTCKPCGEKALVLSREKNYTDIIPVISSVLEALANPASVEKPNTPIEQDTV